MMLPINEIFVSLDGEVNRWGQGRPTVFIRTQGCNLRCDYCDTPETQGLSTHDKFMQIEEIVNVVISSGIKKVTITGGEPLLYKKEIEELCNILLNHSIIISIETNGTISLPYNLLNIKELCFVVDFKKGTLPVEFLAKHKHTSNIWVKFMVENQEDFHEVALAHSFFRRKMPEWDFAISPIHGKVPVSDIMKWMVYYSKTQYLFLSEININVQIHKLIFPDGEKNHILV